ncbi:MULTISPECIES: phosphatidate cytidylyltransferase [Mammaliicoccus]|uniref:phosphatidate cytidylyltransferase n=1 Tax=Mammaliicoccus TaxID=2803850 RepID=UPI000992843B|nr:MULTISPECIES: phosphatidate cytidylyltransferase [Mammaliicoccus]HCN61131.1 phosphatidate cytidylyltransferase [Staphylococcus sp.]MBO3061894.1 phosphatidate cytidylyltransferase [Mammaliicoccus fleurettii]MBW0765274.1 phosphatidate cytidylyltransferase [Mammaliicoccus fleurettii]MDT3995317.1 phosphatidate cytidylyltransferase [Mammaliicoccus fleurettii]MEB6201371.1 phosphatidate cytidylyltransferase [Mammaliicoccus fleurettii]
MNLGKISNEMIVVMIGVFIVLVLSSLICAYLTKRYPDKDFTEIKLRIKSWWGMCIIFTIALVIHSTVSLIFLALLCFLALKEYFSLIPTNRSHRAVLFWAYLSIPIQFTFIYFGFYGMFIIFIPVYMFLFIPIQAIFIGETKGFLQSMGSVQWGLMLMVFSLSHLAYLIVLPGEKSTVPGASLVLFLVILTQANDVFQFLFGKAFGKHKIVPKVSPNKTWEGFVGGILATTILSLCIAPFLTPFTLLGMIIAGIYISIMGFIGDVNISALKRDLNIKDTSQAIPGHGGILDRVDSLTYTAPLFFHFVRFFYF